MLTTITPGQNLRQWTFFGLLFIPIFGLMGVLGIFVGRSSDPIFPIVLALAIAATIGTIVVLGFNFRIGLYMIMYFVLWDRVLSFGQGGTLSATKIAIGLTIVFMTTAILNNQLPYWWRKLGDPLVILGALYILASAFPSAYMPHPEYSTEFIIRRASCVIMMTLLLIAITDRDILHWCVLWLIIGGTTVAIATTSEAITGVGLLERVGKADPELNSQINTLGSFQGATRLVGPSGDPTFYSLAQSLPGVLAFGLFLYYKEWWKKALLVGAIGVIAFNIIGSGSRAGALAAAVGVLLLMLTCPIRHRFAKLAALAGVGVLGMAVMIISGIAAASRVANPTAAATTIEWRTGMWKMAWEMFAANPVIGIGTNSWGLRYEAFRDPTAPGDLQRPLNAFMQMLAECGLQGAAIYTLLYVAAAIAAFSAALGTYDRRLKFEAMSFAGLTFGFFVFAGTSNMLENELYFIVFALAGAAYQVCRRERTHLADLGEDLLSSSEPRVVADSPRLARAGDRPWSTT